MARRRGYTLVELLLVVVILAVAATLLVPSLVRRDTYSIEAALRQLVADITFAQSDALAGQGHRRIQFQLDPSPPQDREASYIGWSVFRVGESAPEIESPDPSALLSADYITRIDRQGSATPPTRPLVVSLDDDPRFRGVWIESVDLDGGRHWLTFDEMGRIEGFGLGGSLVVRSDNLTYRVTIDAGTGKVSVARVEEPSVP